MKKVDQLFLRSCGLCRISFLLWANVEKYGHVSEPKTRLNHGISLSPCRERGDFPWEKKTDQLFSFSKNKLAPSL
jgi:hypothetical protein